MTFGMIAARIGAGLLLGALLLAVPGAVASMTTFNLLVWSLAGPVAALVAFVSAQVDGKHHKWWQESHEGSGVLHYVLINALTGVPLVGVAAYPGMLLGVLGFMAP
jgi:hypothetical protein